MNPYEDYTIKIWDDKSPHNINLNWIDFVLVMPNCVLQTYLEPGCSRNSKWKTFSAAEGYHRVIEQFELGKLLLFY